jgi:hypothetical protein
MLYEKDKLTAANNHSKTGVEHTSVSLFERSSAWEMGVGNFPATGERSSDSKRAMYVTFGETRTQKTRNLLDQSL